MATYTVTRLQEDCGGSITVTEGTGPGTRGPATNLYNYSAPEAITAWQETMKREMPGLFNDPEFAARYGQTAPLEFPKPGMWDPDVMNDLATIWLKLKQEEAGIQADGWLGNQTTNALGDAYSFLRTLNGHDDHLHARNEWHSASIEFIKNVCGPEDAPPVDPPVDPPIDPPVDPPVDPPKPITTNGLNDRPLGDSAHDIPLTNIDPEAWRGLGASSALAAALTRPRLSAGQPLALPPSNEPEVKLLPPPTEEELGRAPASPEAESTPKTNGSIAEPETITRTIIDPYEFTGDTNVRHQLGLAQRETTMQGINAKLKDALKPIDAAIESAPEAAQAHLREMREVIANAAQKVQDLEDANHTRRAARHGSTSNARKTLQEARKVAEQALEEFNHGLNRLKADRVTFPPRTITEQVPIAEKPSTIAGGTATEGAPAPIAGNAAAEATPAKTPGRIRQGFQKASDLATDNRLTRGANSLAGKVADLAPTETFGKAAGVAGKGLGAAGRGLAVGGRALGVAGVALGPVGIYATTQEAEIKTEDLHEATEAGIVTEEDAALLERNSERQITWAWIGGGAAAVGGVALGVLTAPLWLPVAAVGATTAAVATGVTVAAGAIGTASLAISEKQAYNLDQIIADDEMDLAMRNVLSVSSVWGTMRDWVNITYNPEELIGERYGTVDLGDNSDIAEDGTLNMDLKVNQMRLDVLNKYPGAGLSPDTIPVTYTYPENEQTYDLNLTPFEMVRLMGVEETLKALKAAEEAKIAAGLEGDPGLFAPGSDAEAALRELDLINQFQEEAWDMTDLADDAENTTWWGYRHERTPAELVLSRHGIDYAESSAPTASSGSRGRGARPEHPPVDPSTVTAPGGTI